MNHIRCLICLLHIHRGPFGVLAAYRSWKAGTSQVFDLRGQIHP